MARKSKKSRKRSSALAHARKEKSVNPGRAPEKLDPLDDVIEESARFLGLKIDKAWKPTIRANLQVTLLHGALVTGFAMDDEAEPAAVFEP